nr:hypothetical protein [Allomuricauda sp.]
MKLIPAIQIEFGTSLSAEEVAQILKEHTRPMQSIGLRIKRSKSDKLFEGYVGKDSFQIQRVIYGKNSFRPQITGTLRETANGTQLITYFKLHLFVLLFMGMWMGILSMAVAGSLIAMFFYEVEPMGIIFPLLMLIFGGGLVYFGFTTEKETSINKLKSILSLKQRSSTFKWTELT